MESLPVWAIPVRACKCNQYRGSGKAAWLLVAGWWLVMDRGTAPVGALPAATSTYVCPDVSTRLRSIGEMVETRVLLTFKRQRPLCVQIVSITMPEVRDPEHGRSDLYE